REAGRNRQSEGFSQRSGQVFAALARPEQRQEPDLDLLRKNPRGDRKAYILPSRGPASGDLVRVEKGRRDREEAWRVRRADGRARPHGAAGSPALRVVHAGEAGRLRRMQKWPFISLIGA